jgi:hypothetical protein
LSLNHSSCRQLLVLALLALLSYLNNFCGGMIHGLRCRGLTNWLQHAAITGRGI